MKKNYEESPYTNPFYVEMGNNTLTGTLEDGTKKILAPGISLFSIKNITLTNSLHDDKIKISGPTIALTIKDGLWGYYHFIRDILGQTEIIKKYLPKAKIKIFQLCNKEDFDFFLLVLKDRGVLEAYEINDEDIIDLTSHGEILIENLLFIYNDFNYIAGPIINSHYPFEANADHAEWSIGYASLLKKRFLTNQNIKGNRKLFISRALDDKRLRALSEIVHKVFNGYPLSEQEKILFGHIHPKKYAEHADRTMSVSDETKLEKMFEDAGYEIIDPGVSLGTTYEQAELYNSASHIVALPGAGLANLCFANPNVKVLILNNTDSYHFPHLEISRSFGIYCVESPKRMPKSNKIYRPKEIFYSVKKDYPEFLV
jgi:hypothetical protein